MVDRNSPKLVVRAALPLASEQSVPATTSAIMPFDAWIDPEYTA
jgi:hypothetical protein